MTKRPATSIDRLSAVALTLVLHLAALMMPVPLLPPDSADTDLSRSSGTAAGREVAEKDSSDRAGSPEVSGGPGEAHLTAIPYRPHERSDKPDRQLDPMALVPMPLRLPAVPDSGSGFQSLSRLTAAAKLRPPNFSADTIPKKPDKNMFDLIEENADSYLLGDVFQDAVPATATTDDAARREADFLAELRRDIGDGSLDMPFASFIITAEYYQLSRALLARNLQPAFTLDEAFARYRERKTRVTDGLPATIDGYAAVMILQRYAENKFYPGNGSGMLLDSLFHNLNDCEAGTKELLAYLDEFYPALTLGSNRGLLQTTTGELIGHMQVYLGPDPATRKIVAGDRGVVIETTRVGRDSILPYMAGEIYPLEDFVARYYPELVAGTPLADRLAGARGHEPGDPRRIVGTSDHPLKMSYGGSGTLLTAQYYDLANIRTRKIENEFLRSAIPSCDPRIDPTRIDRANLFSNFVAIDPKLRKNLIDHYLAGLDYWDNQLMPQWKAPEFVATYADLAGSLLGGKTAGTGQEPPEGYLQVDAENTVAMRSMRSHERFLLAMRRAAAPDKHLGTGRQECRDRTVLDERLLTFLFATPSGPGFYFLPEPAADLSWPQVVTNVVDDCLAVPAHGPARNLIAALEDAAAMGIGEENEKTSLRRELYKRAMTRGLDPATQDEVLAKSMAAVAAILTGRPGDSDPALLLATRHSAESRPEEPSVRETVLERGRTGINSGLIWDVFDFLDEERVRAGILSYAGREDLRLSVRRAGELIDSIVTILAGQNAGGPEAGERLLAEIGREGMDPQLTLAAELALARLQGLDPAAVSTIAVHSLQKRKPYRAENLLALLGYGLRPEDGRAFLRGRAEEALAGLPKLTDQGADGGADQEIFVELVELARTIDALTDLPARQAMAEGLMESLARDFDSGVEEGSQPDFGLVFTKLSVLALVRETCGGRELRVDPKEFLQRAVRFAAGQPAGKLMVGLLEKVLTPDQYAAGLGEIIGDQFAELARLQQLSSPGRAGDLRQAQGRVKIILGDANVLSRMLLRADASVATKAADRFPAPATAAVAASYLEQLHRRAAGIVAEGRGGDAYVADFYLDDRVRESMAMLAFVREDGQQGGNGDRVRFRKIQDIRTIKNPEKIQVIEAERKITRQDMSLLTLALNEDNTPREIRRAWDGTLAVAGGHLTLAPRDGPFAAYLFAPHFPYLQGDDLGFFFSPETVEDLHNADQWGGRNDILLSSYLHFRNLPERLPDWLLRAALTRSEFERQIIEKFERQSFLPMILECAGDHETLPEGLFRAQWTIRKPFGEDIFPGTLLLLRMGYMAISPEGELVFTSKYTG